MPHHVESELGYGLAARHMGCDHDQCHSWRTCNTAAGKATHACDGGALSGLRNRVQAHGADRGAEIHQAHLAS